MQLEPMTVPARKIDSNVQRSQRNAKKNAGSKGEEESIV